MRVEKLGPARECGPKIPALTRPAATLAASLIRRRFFDLSSREWAGGFKAEGEPWSNRTMLSLCFLPGNRVLGRLNMGEATPERLAGRASLIRRRFFDLSSRGEPDILMSYRVGFCGQFAPFRKPIRCVVVELFRVENCMLLLRK